MLKEYTLNYYEPAAARSAALRANHNERAKGLVRWKRSVFRGWPSVAVNATSYEALPGEHSAEYRVTAQVALGDLEASDVDVQVIYGPVDLDDDLVEPVVASMVHHGDGDLGGRHRYQLDLEFKRAGTFGYTVRVVPAHPDVRHYAHLGRVAWASGAPGPA
jgi:starch phosphorylase